MDAKSFSIATAVALLFISGGVVARRWRKPPKPFKSGAAGINSCKGQSFCATAKNACAGQNTCKGKGWLKVSRKECSAKGGRVLPDKI